MLYTKISQRSFGQTLVRAMIMFIAMVMVWSTYTPQVSAATANDTVITLNVSGPFKNKGKTTKVTKDVKKLAEDYRPLAIGLQEVCGKQHRSIRAALKKLGYTATFTKTRQSGSCNDKSHGNAFGNSLYIHGKFTDRTRTKLPWGKNKDHKGIEPRTLLCVTAQKTRICNVHISPGDPDSANQLDKVASKLKPYAAKGMVVRLMGDFNRPYKAPTQHIPFLKVCTNPGRIDYVLSTDSRTCSTVLVASSDHDGAVIATK